MKLTSDSLSKLNTYVGAPVKKTFEWDIEGETVEIDVWVRKMSYKTAKDGIFKDADSEYELLAKYVSALTCNEDGSRLFSESDITGEDEDGNPIMIKDENGKKIERGGLKLEFLRKIADVVSEANAVGKQESDS